MDKGRKIAILVAVAALLGLASMSDTVQSGIKSLIAKFGNWLEHPNAKKYLPALNAAESKYGIPQNLLARIAYQESRWRDDIITGQLKSKVGATGIMQLMPKYHPTVNALDPLASIDYAGAFLAGLYKQFKSWPLAVAAYNAGAGNVTKYKGIPPFKETQNYVSQVFSDLVTDQNRGYYA